MFDIDTIVRENIKRLKPYSSSRDEFNGEAKIFLDANENSFGSPLNDRYNRYPDPHQTKLKEAISKVKKIDSTNIFLGNGSDECIDLLFRCFCEPGKDNVIISPPTYGMYEVSASINNVEVKKVLIDENFQPDLAGIKNVIDKNTKIIWLCSPNNPTGNSINKDVVKKLMAEFNGLVVIDEAYIDFSSQPSFLNELNGYSNLVVLQTFSKAWGLAALRLGIAFASPAIIQFLNKIKPPYNISGATQQLALEAISNSYVVKNMVNEIVEQRKNLAEWLKTLSIVESVYPSDANFLLVKTKNAMKVYQHLLLNGIVVRDRSNVILCNNCLRITVGTTEENNFLTQTLLNYSNEQ